MGEQLASLAIWFTILCAIGITGNENSSLDSSTFSKVAIQRFCESEVADLPTGKLNVIKRRKVVLRQIIDPHKGFGTNTKDSACTRDPLYIQNCEVFTKCCEHQIYSEV